MTPEGARTGVDIEADGGPTVVWSVVVADVEGAAVAHAGAASEADAGVGRADASGEAVG